METDGVLPTRTWELVEWIFCGFLVFIYARNRFSTPKHYVASTTIYLYRLASTLYCAAVVITYIVLAGVLQSSPDILNGLGWGSEGLADELADISGPILAALLLTTLLPHFPVLKQLDEWLLNTFRDIGNIPLEVRSWRHRLSRRTPQVPDHVMDKFQRWVAQDTRTSAIQSYLSFANDGSPQSIFTLKVLFPMYCAESFGDSARYQRMLNLFGDKLDMLNKKFIVINHDAKVYFTLSRDAEGQAGSNEPPTAIQEICRNFVNECNEFYATMCELIAYGLLNCEQNQKRRVEKLRALGFPEFEPHLGRMSADRLILASFVVAVIFLAVFAFLGSERVAIQRWVLITAMVATIYGVSAFCAIFPKRWPFANALETRGRPASGYLLSGVLAVIAAFFISLLFRGIYHFDFVKAFQAFEWTYPYFLMSFTLAIVLAWLADDGIEQSKEPEWLSWVEGLVAAICMAGTAYLVHTWLTRLPYYPPPGVPPLAQLLVTGAGAGFVMGTLIPQFYRKSARMAADVPPELASETDTTHEGLLTTP